MLPLDLTGLAVTAVSVDGTRTDARVSDGKVIVPLPPGHRIGQQLRVRVEYAGTPDDGLAIRNNLHGRRAIFADNWPNRARFWFPALDYPADKATATLTVDAPTGWKVIANGERRQAAVANRWIWDIAEPISTYNIVIGAADMDVASAGRSCVPAAHCVDVTTWLFPEDRARAAKFHRAPQMVTFFSRHIAPFPYEKLAHVESSTRFGGMENATAIFYDEKRVSADGDIDALVAHETAHQWFGDSVTPATWADLWLSEGFATYFATLFFEDADGVATLRQRMDVDRRTVIGSKVASRPIVDPREPDLFKLLNENNYEKGGWVLHMLRGLVGDRAFFDGVRRYYAAHAHGTATTADFRSAVEHASGRELGWFFDQWVLQPGFPRLRVTWNWSPTVRAADIVIEQTQDAAWPTFRLPLTLAVRTAGGVVRRTIEIDERRETVRIPLRAEVTGVDVDPDVWALMELHTTR